MSEGFDAIKMLGRSVCLYYRAEAAWTLGLGQDTDVRNEQ